MFKFSPREEVEVLLQVQSEFNQAQGVTMDKRYTFRDRLQQFSNQIKQPDKISVNLCFSTINAMIATSYSDVPQVKFVEREFTDATQAQMWSKIAEFDYEEMGMEEINYERLWDKYFYGVGITQFDKRDNVSQNPIVKNIDPMTIIPDPKGWRNAEDFRFMGMQSLSTWEDMKNDGFDNIDNFVTSGDYEFFMYDPYNRIEPNTEESTNEDIRYRYVYYHYTIYKGKKYQIATNYDMTVIGRVIPVDAMLQQEKKDPRKVMRPFTMSYYRPQRHNPYGISIMDLTEDKQRATSKLLNLGMARAIRSSLGEHKLYNKDKLSNINDVARMTAEPQYIGVSIEAGESINDIISEVQTSPVPKDNYDISNAIQYNTRIATGIDPLTMGIQGSGDMTATEAQQIQSNANLLLSLGNKIDIWGERDFWTKWLKMYRSNFKGKKLVRIKNPLGTNMISINASDIKTKSDPDVIIESKAKIKSANDKKVQLEMAIQPFLAGVPMMNFSQRYAYRKFLVDSEICTDEDEARVIISEMPEEIEARGQLEMLNRNDELSPESFTDLSVDWDAYLTIWKQAIDTPAKRSAILKGLQAKVLKQKQEKAQQAMMGGQGQPGNQALQNSAGNQAMAGAMQQTKPLITTSDVTPQ